MFERFTDRARRVVVLAQEEARILSHNYIGTEHILLGLIREGEGVAGRVLVRLGADLNPARQQVIQLLHGYQGEDPDFWDDAPGGPRSGRVAPGVLSGVTALESRLSAIEQRVGTRPATADLDEQIAQARRDRESAIDSCDFEQAGSLRDREVQLVADKDARHQRWEAAHPDLASLAEQVQRLSSEVDRLRDLVRQHGIEPEDKTA